MLTPTAHKKRKTYNEPGHVHELTFSCYKRLPLLNNDAARTAFLEGLRDAKDKLKFELWAYVLMPEHVHLLIWPLEPDYSISEVLSKIKSPVSRSELARLKLEDSKLFEKLKVIEKGKPHWRFWQAGGGFDRNMFSPHVLKAAINYIHANPVRRGLAKCETDWVWSSARFYAQMPGVLLQCDSCEVL